jgi:peptidase M28-like protein
MVAVPPAQPERRRPRPGSLERPVNGRLYRGTWLLLGLPLLVAAFSVARPVPLPPPQVSSGFDGENATALAKDLAERYPNRFPGSAGALGAAAWLKDQLRPYGFQVRTDSFTAVIPGTGRVRLQNLLAEAVGRSSQTIVVMAHRDDNGVGQGANDNASGTAALVELARSYSARVIPAHTIVFLSTDGGAFGGLGAARFLERAPERHDVIAVVNLDAIAGHGPIRLQIAGDTPRSPSGTLLQTASARITAETGQAPQRPSALDQLIDLGLPFTLHEQGPFLAKGIPALTITTAGDRPPEAASDTRDRLDSNRFDQVGNATQSLVATLDQGLEFAQGTSSYLDIGRLIRGWAVELVLIAALLPFLAAAVDLFALCRRRHIPLTPALRSYRSRLGFWLWVALVFELFTLAGAWPGGASRPLAPTTSAARDWPSGALLGLGMLALVGWLVSRERLIPRRAIRSEEELAGHTAALLCLGALSLVVAALNPFSLVFLLPSLHAWLWLPNMQGTSRWSRAAVVMAGFLGPAVLVGSFATRYDLGWDAPWYLLELRAVGYLPFAVLAVAVAWLAGAAQLASLAAGRYAPYPSAAEQRPRGPIRQLLRHVLVARRARRRATGEERDALEG